MNTYNFLNLPSFACSYCGVHHIDCVVKCTSPECNRWFCNTKYEYSNRSHVMNHMYKSRHNTIQDYYGNHFQCERCGEKNIYLLKTNIRKRNIFCNFCIKNKNSRHKINHKRWHPLIMEHRLPLSMIPKPFQEDFDKMIILTTEEIKCLENAWKIGFFGRYEMLRNYDGESPYPFVHKAKNIYEDQDDYLRILRNLLDLHEKDSIQRVEEYYQEDVVLMFLSSHKVLLLKIFNYDFFGGTLKKGSYLSITFSGRKEFSFEVVITFIDNKKIEIVADLLDKKLKIPFHYKEKSFKVHVRPKWRGESIRRMSNALLQLQNNPTRFFQRIKHLFWKNSEDSEKYSRTLPINQNKSLIDSLTINLSESTLNEHQKTALESSLKLGKVPITLVQGPPGTGKTKVIFEMIKQINEWNSNPNKKVNLRVLFCAPSNIAVDNVAIELKKNKIEFLRIYSRIREENDEIEQLLKDVSLHTLMRKEAGFRYHSLLRPDAIKHYFDTEKKLLKTINIICCTCSGVGDRRFDNIELFDYVIIDEAAQSLEMETLLPLNHCKTKLVLFGDHQQLGPLVFSNLAKAMGLGISFFERMIKNNFITPVFLASQYRMHQAIADFPSNTFYGGRIETKVTREIDNSFPWPVRGIPLMFHDINGKEEIGPMGTSFRNMAEADFVRQTIDQLIRINKKPENIGIITPYLAQKHFLLNEMDLDLDENGRIDEKEDAKENRYKGITVNTIDGFQGKEKDYIVISCVRSNEELGVGFLHDINRVNVALTRAKYGLIICGNVNTLKKNEIWGKIIHYYRERRVLIMDDY